MISAKDSLKTTLLRTCSPGRPCYNMTYITEIRVTTVCYSPCLCLCDLVLLHADQLGKVSTKFSFHKIQFHGECFCHHKTVPSSEKVKPNYSFWSTGCSFTPLLLQGADPMIPMIPHPLELVCLYLAQECSLCHQLQVLARSHTTVWALSLRIPTMKV